MRLIVGLGNPGTEYALTRHNIGWDVIDSLTERVGVGRPAQKFGGAYWGPVVVNGEHVCFLKPYTYMNNSGVAVGELVRFYKIAVSDVLVVVDDINLPVGRMRLRAKGSAGGHNGLKSIIAHLSSQDFPRLRIGVGACPQFRTMVDWVLGRFSPEERNVVDRVIAAAASYCEEWCSSTTERLMNSVNRCDSAIINGEA